MIGRHFGIFNVINDHQCHRERSERRARRHHAEERVARGVPEELEPDSRLLTETIIRPFDAITDFHGCILCGKYHICEGLEFSCPVVYNAYDQLKTCLYTGRLLKQITGLELKNSVESKRVSDEINISMARYLRLDASSKTSPFAFKRQRFDRGQVRPIL